MTSVVAPLTQVLKSNIPSPFGCSFSSCPLFPILLTPLILMSLSVVVVAVAAVVVVVVVVAAVVAGYNV